MLTLPRFVSLPSSKQPAVTRPEAWEEEGEDSDKNREAWGAVAPHPSGEEEEALVVETKPAASAAEARHRLVEAVDWEEEGRVSEAGATRAEAWAAAAGSEDRLRSGEFLPLGLFAHSAGL